MKKNIILIMLVTAALFLFLVWAGNEIRTPVTLETDALVLRFTIDDLIEKSEVIAIGKITTNLPSQWNGPDGITDPKNVSVEEIARAKGLFTDSLVDISQTLKGDSQTRDLRVRSFIGQTENINWINENEPLFDENKTYLFFLVTDIGATAKVNPGDYVPLGAYQGVYEIIDGKAISSNDEWMLEELIDYIQGSLSSDTFWPSPIASEIVTPTP